MTSITSSDQVEGVPARAAGRRRRFPAISGIHLLILATGVLAFVTNLVLLRGGESALPQMAVSRVDLVAGRNLRAEDIRLTPVDVEESVAAGLISESDLTGYEGWVVTGQAASGSLLSKANLRAPLTGSGLRAMSFPVDIEHAAGGNLIPGDRVDVIRVDEDQASFVATDLPVLEVPGQAEGALGLSGAFYVVLEVDDRTALTLALALAHAQVEVVRSTGSTPVTIHLLEDRRPDEGALRLPAGQQDDFLPAGSADSGGRPPDGSVFVP